MDAPAGPRIQSGWGRIALAFGLFLILSASFDIVFLSAVIPVGATEDIEAFKKKVAEPQMLAAFLTLHTVAGVLTAIFMAKSVDRRRLGDLGVRADVGALGWGLFLGVVFATVVTLFISAAGRRHVDPSFFERTRGVNAPLFALVVFVAAFMEELLFRGYVYVNLREMYAAGRAVILSSLAFATAHTANPESGPLAWINVVLFGVVLGQLREITGGIMMPLGLHVGWNLSLGMLFGVRVSGLNLPSAFHVALEDLPDALGGGRFGPEASLVLTGLLLVIVLLLARRLRPVVPEEGGIAR